MKTHFFVNLFTVWKEAKIKMNLIYSLRKFNEHMELDTERDCFQKCVETKPKREALTEFLEIRFIKEIIIY